MLNNLAFENYRAFSRGNIDLCPITILMGINGSGKTSILNLFTILAQTASAAAQHGPPSLRVNGPLCTTGAIENIFYKKKPSTITIRIGLEKNVISKILDDIHNSLSNSLQAAAERLFFYVGSLQIRDHRLAELSRRADLLLFRRHATENGEQYLNEIKTFYFGLREALMEADKPLPQDLIAPSDQQWLQYWPIPATTRKLVSRHDILPRDASACLAVYQLLREHSNANLQLKFILYNNIRNKSLAIKSISIGDEKDDILAIDFTAHDVSLKADFPQEALVAEYNLQIFEIIKNNSNIFNAFANHINAKSLYSATIGQLFHEVLNFTGRQFTNGRLIHIGPLRAYPRRYYSPTSSEVDTDANLVIESLRFHESLRAKINSWFETFNIRVGVEDVEDFLSKIVVFRNDGDPNHKASSERQKDVNESNAEYYDLIDSGFGYSQILPVIVRTLAASDDSVVLVEQPEIHLHPGMQSDLGDFFIDAVINKSGQPNGKKVIIETHSEYLIKRIQRRIATGDFPSSFVSLNFIEAEGSTSSSTVRRIAINSDGNFKWPDQFFSKDIDDMFALFNAAATK